MSTSASAAGHDPVRDGASTSGPAPDGAHEEAHVESAGAFDVRTFIGTLIGIFGVILTLVGLFAFSEAESAKTGGLNANLWAGLIMIVAAIVFLVWAKVAPIRILVQENEPGAEEEKDLSAVS